MERFWLYLFEFFILLHVGVCRIHKLEIKHDYRKYISVSTFGFYQGGLLEVKLKHFRPDPFSEDDLFGFTLDRTRNDAMNSYLDSHQDRCLLEQSLEDQMSSSYAAVVYFILNLKDLELYVNCSRTVDHLHINKNASEALSMRNKRYYLTELSQTSKNLHAQQQQQKALSSSSITSAGDRTVFDSMADSSVNDFGTPCTEHRFPITVEEDKDKKYKFYSTSFGIRIMNHDEEGLYNLYFHNCPNYKDHKNVALEFVMEIQEKNGLNFLSAGEMPLPALYFMMSILFMLSGCFWVFIIAKSKHPVFKIHYLMAVLVYLKSLSLLFHAINYHFIQTRGEHVATWAILYYITHLLKGSVLFITIVLIGTGWNFIKHLLSEKDKKIFMIVIPLQVLANVANIIIEESEEGDIEHRTWLDVFTLVDVLCCGAILFPVVWSIRHLQEASHTDGKAAINLRKLKLFRHFYIMILCYIYFTRIIIYLLQLTVPFQYEWLDEMFREMVTYVFFVMTGYKFRPASANPYFQVNQDEEEEDEEVEILVSHCGITEGLSKLSRVAAEPAEDEKETLLFSKRESSHEYD